MIRATGRHGCSKGALLYVSNVASRAMRSASVPRSQVKDGCLGWASVYSDTARQEVHLLENLRRVNTHLTSHWAHVALDRIGQDASHGNRGVAHIAQARVIWPLATSAAPSWTEQAGASASFNDGLMALGRYAPRPQQHHVGRPVRTTGQSLRPRRLERGAVEGARSVVHRGGTALT